MNMPKQMGYHAFHSLVIPTITSLPKQHLHPTSHRLPITSSEIAKATRTDTVLSKVYHYTQSGWPEQLDEAVKPYHQKKHEPTVEGHCLMWGICVIVRSKHRGHILNKLHHDHPGCSRMKSLAHNFVWWLGMDQDIETVAKSCSSCQHNKNAPSRAPLHPWTWLTKPLQRIHIDYAGPFPS